MDKNAVNKKKRRLENKAESSEDEGVMDPNPPKTSLAGKSEVKTVKNSDGDEMIPIGKMRYVTVREFKGKRMVDIREFYEDKSGGGLKPGKKGICLSAEQFNELKSLLPELEKRLKPQRMKTETLLFVRSHFVELRCELSYFESIL
ncbi:hypothetical protein L596_013659 [Steinernema carpocapsae]|uniref:Transcriptional coactivator p15 (PC4) C-terminal domain-containing protein n=1 Tax=Steinernema carpocapsae TaxID=34508 RepID=A0A4U5P0U1_STECR|nr:hypothetical protein L596_013659 [Steinernema carpocapsae]